MSERITSSQPGMAKPSTSPSPERMGEVENVPIPRSSSDDEGDEQPQDSLEPFDWQDLDNRYQQMVQLQNSKEAKLWDEYNQLAEFFSLWAAVSQGHEVDRATKRLATRLQHVQHSEADFEAKRLHYTRVVEAFQSALRLLSAS